MDGYMGNLGYMVHVLEQRMYKVVLRAQHITTSTSTLVAGALVYLTSHIYDIQCTLWDLKRDVLHNLVVFYTNITLPNVG